MLGRRAFLGFCLAAALAAAGCRAVPVGLYAGIGTGHHSIATSSPQAQEYFDQGLALVYAFEFDAAAASFQRASQLDPHAAMPYWGLALAWGPNYNDPAPARQAQACAAIAQAQRLATGANGPDRAYIAALGLRCSDPARYAAAMRALYRSYPDDPDAATLFANSLMVAHARQLWNPDGTPGPDTAEIESVLEGVLRRWPNHVGANHLYLHAMEASPFPARALGSAARLPGLAPDAGHLVHMPAHIYMRTGDYAAAVRATAAALLADQQSLARLNGAARAAYEFGYAEHNRQALVAAAAMQGEYPLALANARQLDAYGRSAAAAEGYTVVLPLLLVRMGRWDEILKQSPPARPAQALFWHYARGCAFAATGQLRRAAAERAALRATYAQLPPGGLFGRPSLPWSTWYALTSATLEARIAAAGGDWPGAIAAWRRVVEAEDRLPNAEPPAWYPARESLGAALLRAGEAGEAAAVFRAALARHPGDPRALFGLWSAMPAPRPPLHMAWSGPPLRLADF